MIDPQGHQVHGRRRYQQTEDAHSKKHRDLQCPIVWVGIDPDESKTEEEPNNGNDEDCCRIRQKCGPPQ